MFGPGFGAESEARDAHRHITGRRHGPREMTNDSGLPYAATDNTVQAQQVFQTHRAAQQRHMETSPSFLDQMFESRGERQQKTTSGVLHHASGVLPGSDYRGGAAGGMVSSTSSPQVAVKGGGAGGAGAVYHGYPPGKEPLNIFSWNDEYQQKGLRDKLITDRNAEMRTLCPGGAVVAQDYSTIRRDDDARKFERSTDNHFLSFGEDKRKAPVGLHPMGAGSKSPPFAVNYEQRDVPADPAVHHPSRRRAGPPVSSESSALPFEGFPGLGGANGGVASNYASPASFPTATSSSMYPFSPKVPSSPVAVPRPISNVFLSDLPGGPETLASAPRSATSTEIQRQHQLRTKAEVGIPCPSTTGLHRHLGPYSTSNASYGVEGSGKRTKRYPPPKGSSYAGEPLNYASIGGEVPSSQVGKMASEAGQVSGMAYHDYGSGYLPSSSMDTQGGGGYGLTPSQTSYYPATQQPYSSPGSSYPSSGYPSTTPTTLSAGAMGGAAAGTTGTGAYGGITPARHDYYSVSEAGYGIGKDAGMGSAQVSPHAIPSNVPSTYPSSEVELAEYEQELRRSLPQRQQVMTGGEASEADMAGGAGTGYTWNLPERLEPTAYEYSPEKGFMETPREVSVTPGGVGGGYAVSNRGGNPNTSDMAGMNTYSVASSPMVDTDRRVRFQA